MNPYGNNSTNNYAGNTSNSFPNYGTSGFELNIAQQSQYGHRASAPDTLELSRSHDLPQDISQIPLEQFIKPIQHQPWNSHGFRAGVYSSRLQQPSWPNDVLQPGRSAMTEPAPNQDQDLFMQRSNSRRGPETEDSGYHSQLSSSGGHFSDSYSSNKKELEQDFLPGFGNRLDSNHVNERRPPPPRSVVSDHVVSGRVSRKLPISRCPDCGRQAKNASDAKKHAFTHEKPYKCEERGCSRKEGFATVNDRERHRKSVHHVRPTVGNSSGYICAACVQNGSKENKFWPRRDNFKAHIKRKHKDNNEAQLLEMSKAQRPDDAISIYGDHSIYISQSRNVSQMDRTEGIAYQNQLPNESSPTISRHTSQQEDVEMGALFDSAVEIHEDSFIGMGSHVNGMNSQHEQYEAHYIGPSNAAGLEALGQAASIQNDTSNYLHPSSAQQPTKRRRVGSASSYTGGFGNEQQPGSISFATASPTSKLEAPAQAMHTPASNSPPNEHKCPECNKIKKRECDLKKHMKRHTRPYGCTFASCAKKFGSRNDWKRHENGQHFLSEMWKCGRSRILDGGSCRRRPFHTLDQMQRHLRGPEHQMTNPREIEEECKKFHLGREGHVHYWCGFCKALVRQPEFTTNAWENRFKHIGDHFDHDKKNIDDWVCIEENKAKKHISPQEEKAARRRAREGNRVEEEGELEEWTPDMNAEFSNGGSFGGMKISSTADKMGEDDPDADGESDGEAYTGMR